MLRQIIIYLLILSSIITSESYPSDHGRPFVKNYSPKDYEGSAQNWAAVQDKRGVLYFANQAGVIEYDGVNWRRIQILDDRTAFAISINNNIASMLNN